MKRWVTWAVLVVWSLPLMLWGEVVDLPTAYRAAQSWFYHSVPFNRLAQQGVVFQFARQGNLPRGVFVLRNDSQSPPLGFVFALEPRGFIVVPADDRLNPILAYSETSVFDTTRVPENILLDYLLVDLTQKFRALLQGAYRISAADSARQRWQELLQSYSPEERFVPPRQTEYDVEIGPLIETHWNQGVQGGYNVFNYYTPNHYSCGCVALAMAQLLKYYDWPPVGTGSHSYYENGRYHYVNFSSTYYQWGLMLYTYSWGSRSANRKAAGKLTYHCGVAVDMEYGYNGSTASTQDVPNALYSYFRHSGVYVYRSSSSFWSRLNDNLLDRRPTQLSIKSSSGVGHSINVDGIRYNYGGQKYYHLNMGWGGSGDAWYDISDGFYSGGVYWSTINGVVLDVLPIPVVNGMGTNHTGTYTVSWQVSPRLNAQKFQIDEGTGTPSNISWHTLTTSLTDTFFVVPGKSNGRYYYRVRAYRDGKWWPYSKWRSVIVDLDPPTLSVSRTEWTASPYGAVSPPIEVFNSGSGSCFDYTVSENADWLSVSSASGTTPGSFTITATPNTSGSLRSAQITVAGQLRENGSPQIITVTQDTMPAHDYLLSFDGTNDSIFIPDSNDQLDLGATWTIELVLNVKSRTGTDNILYRHDQFEIYIRSSSYADYSVGFASLGGSTHLRELRSDGPGEDCSLNTWYHLAVSCDGDTARLFINGKVVDAVHSLYWDLTNAGFDNALNIAAKYDGGYMQYCNCYLDEIRISDVARYTEEFTVSPTTLHLMADDHTRLLLHLDEGDGTVLHDASGHFAPSLNRGEPYNPAWVLKDSLIPSTMQVSLDAWDAPHTADVSPPVQVTHLGSGGEFEYTVSADATWISLSANNGTTPGSFTIQVADNPHNFLRQDTITVSAPPGVAQSPHHIIVRQEENHRNEYVLSFDGQDDSFYIPDTHDKLDLGASWTVELWLNVRSRSGYENILYRHDQFEMHIAPPTGSRDYRLYFRALDGGTHIRYLRTTGDDEELDFNTWYHIAVSCYNGYARLFVNGHQVMSDSDNDWKFYNDGFDNALNIGAEYTGTYQKYLDGYIDELRISDVARYTSDFNVSWDDPTFSADEHTRLLLHLDEGEGTQLHDAAGNFQPSLNRGEPHNPTWVPVSDFQNCRVATRIFLEGAYRSASGTMSTALLQQDRLPLTQPYQGAPFNYDGDEAVNAVPAGVVDWVLLELRSELPDFTLVAQRAAFVTAQGNVVDLDGSSAVSFENLPGGTYYLVVRHRNHLAVMSATALNFQPGATVNYDFTDAMGRAYSEGADPMKELAPGVYGLIAGDGDASGVVDVLDRENVWLPQNGTAYSYQKYGDFNLDGGIDALELNGYWIPNQGRVAQLPGARGITAVRSPMPRQVAGVYSSRGRKGQKAHTPLHQSPKKPGTRFSPPPEVKSGKKLPSQKLQRKQRRE